MLIATKPIANNNIVHLFVSVIFEALYKNRQTIIFINPQITFNNGEDNPLPGGFAKGVGK
jgi:hypothetical protein